MPSREIQHLHPVPAYLFGTLAERVARLFPHLEIFPTCTHRENLEQEEEYAKGRTAPGQKTTNAEPGQSWHNMITPDGRPASLAVDFAFRVFDPLTLKPKPGSYFADAPLELYKAVGFEADVLGFEPGSFWPNPDGPHLEWHPGFERLGDHLAGQMADYNARLYSEGIPDVG